jgi:hypothetical protein
MLQGSFLAIVAPVQKQAFDVDVRVFVFSLQMPCSSTLRACRSSIMPVALSVEEQATRKEKLFCSFLNFLYVESSLVSSCLALYHSGYWNHRVSNALSIAR